MDRQDGRNGEKEELTPTARAMQSASPWMDLTWRFLGPGVVWGLAGYFADRWLETEPWLLLTGSSVGIVVGFIAFWRGYQQLTRRKDGK